MVYGLKARVAIFNWAMQNWESETVDKFFDACMGLRFKKNDKVQWKGNEGKFMVKYFFDILEWEFIFLFLGRVI